MSGGHAVERRHSDERRGLGTALSGFLVTSPDLDEVARLVVALLAGLLGTEAAAIVGRVDGRVDLLGDWVPPAHGEAVRAALVEGAASMLANDSVRDLRALDATVRWAAAPLGAEGEPIGALAIAMARPVDSARVHSCLRELGEILAIYVAGVQRGALDPPAAADDDPPLEGPPPLTARQAAVLRLLAQGITMRQIAARIGFSDSTVRAESLLIYRALGVHDREHAIAAARRLGMLDEAARRRGGATPLPRAPMDDDSAA